MTNPTTPKVKKETILCPQQQQAIQALPAKGDPHGWSLWMTESNANTCWELTGQRDTQAREAHDTSARWNDRNETPKQFIIMSLTVRFTFNQENHLEN